MTFQVSYAQGELLAMVLPGVITPVTLFQAGSLRTEITLLMSPTVPGGAVSTVQIYHDDNGTTYDNTTLVESIQLTPGAVGHIRHQAQTPGTGIILKPGGSIGVACSIINTVNFSCYGITETLAERVRGLNNG